MLLPSWLVISPSLWLQIAIVAVWVGCVGLLAEGLHRYTSADSELVRKVVHIGTGNVILLAWWLQVPGWLGIGASVLFSAIAFLSYRFPILPGINGVGRKSLGTFFYAVSIGVLIAGFWAQQPQFAVLGVLVMTWGDGMAALIGQRFGQHAYKLWGIQKSWEGSLAMALVSFIVGAGVLTIAQGQSWQTWTIAAIVALLATGLEAFSKYGVDNLTVPLGSAIAAFLLSQSFLS
jgi:phytol kinase